MKKQLIIIGMSVLLLTIALSGCTSETQDVQKVPFLYVVTGTHEDDDYVYVDIQNIDTEDGEFLVEFYLTYIDLDTGSDYYGGGSTSPGDNKGIDYGFNAVFETMSPHETETFRCPKRVPSGWGFGGWEYEVIPPKKTQ